MAKKLNLATLKGKDFEGSINGIKVSGKIQVQEGDIYLCQNKIAGSSCYDLLGYRYSFVVGDNIATMRKTGVTSFKVDNVTYLSPRPSDGRRVADWTVKYDRKRDRFIHGCGAVVSTPETVQLLIEYGELGNRLKEAEEEYKRLAASVKKRKLELEVNLGGIRTTAKARGYVDIYDLDPEVLKHMLNLTKTKQNGKVN
jgi:hypothetical protein